MAVSSEMLPLGTIAPKFALPDTEDIVYSSEEFRDAPAMLVMFLCNHCPYVKHVSAEIARIGKEYGDRGVAIFGISSNDISRYPDDAPEKMRAEKARAGYTFPYMYDESQDVARAYHAACTPDFFLFDSKRKLVYRGQLDDSRPNNGKPVTGRDLRDALDAVLDGRPVTAEQVPSIGCSIKWRA